MSDEQFLDRLIKSALQKEVSEAVERAIAKAQADIDRDIRDAIGRIVVACMQEFHVDRMGNMLTISVKMPEKKP